MPYLKEAGEDLSHIAHTHAEAANGGKTSRDFRKKNSKGVEEPLRLILG